MTQQAKATSQQRHQIEGVVLDRDSKPIRDVSVRVYRLGNFSGVSLLGESRTQPDGSYAIEFEHGMPVMARYESEDWHPTIINHVSGARDHTIHKVMHAVGLAYAQDELLEILSTYERIYLIDVAHDIPLDEIRSKYRGNLGMIKYVDPLTQQRYEQVIELYDKGDS